jgi:hypothetical protein
MKEENDSIFVGQLAREEAQIGGQFEDKLSLYLINHCSIVT